MKFCTGILTFITISFQVQYYFTSNPTHWITLPDIPGTSVNISGLAGSSSSPKVTDTPAGKIGPKEVVVLVRARNEHGLSPPSPLSKPLMPEPNPEAKDPRFVRQALGQAARIVELARAEAAGSRKIKLEWEVRKKKESDN